VRQNTTLAALIPSAANYSINATPNLNPDPNFSSNVCPSV